MTLRSGEPDVVRYYVLVDGKPVPERNPMAWAAAIGSPANQIALTEVNGARISTIFLGIDMSWGMGPSLLFETMVFGQEMGKLNGRQLHYATLEEAVAGHNRMVAEVRSVSPLLIRWRRIKLFLERLIWSIRR